MELQKIHESSVANDQRDTTMPLEQENGPKI
jgi:hypothetical protein